MDVGMYERAVENAAKIVHNVKPDQLDDPTPCTEWKVRDLLNHIVGGCEAIVTGYEGGAMRDFDEGDRLGDDYIGAFDRASEGSVEVWKQPDAFDKIFKAPWGDTPGMVLFNLALGDAVVHGWDLAQATGSGDRDRRGGCGGGLSVDHHDDGAEGTLPTPEQLRRSRGSAG